LIVHVHGQVHDGDVNVHVNLNVNENPRRPEAPRCSFCEEASGRRGYD